MRKLRHQEISLNSEPALTEMVHPQSSPAEIQRELGGNHSNAVSTDYIEPTNENAPLQRALRRQKSRGEFVESSGALFMPLVKGGFCETPYCPTCFRTMWCFHEAFPYECTNRDCGKKTKFTGKQLKAVLGSLNNK